MKTITSLAFILTVGMGILFPMDIFAQTAEYKMLAPLPGITKDGSNDTSTIASYIPGMVQLIIALAGAMAVVMIIIGGIQYMSSDAFSGKEEGKNRIWNAIWGLMLAISAFVILNTLNPDLVKFNLIIPGLEGGAPIDGNLGKIESHGKDIGKEWKDDSAERNALQEIKINGKSMVAFNRLNCEKIGQSACTSVYGLNPTIISKIKEMISHCQEVGGTDKECKMIITGGTEYWLHGNRNTDLTLNNTQHRPGGRALDLSISSPFIKYLTGGTPASRRNRGVTTPSRNSPEATSCAPGEERYLYKGVLFVNEGSKSTEGLFDENAVKSDPYTHYHVCF